MYVLWTGSDNTAIDNAADCWANQFQTEVLPSLHAAAADGVEQKWTKEFMEGNAAQDEDLLARDYLELFDTQEQKR